MSLTRHLILYFFLLLSSSVIATAGATAGQIGLQTFPALDSVYPLSVPVRIVLANSDAGGKTLEGTRFHIRLYAPPPGRFLSTDYPLVENTLLIEMDLVAAQGTAFWEYVFPIRGVYRLEVAALNGAGKEVTAIFPLRIRESKAKLLYLGVFVVFLFLFGVVVGRLFTTPNKAGYLKVGLLLVMCALLVAAVKGNEPRVNPVPRTYVRGVGALPSRGVQNIHPRAHARGVLWYGVKETGNKGPLPRLEISPPRVGQPSDIQWRLTEGETERLLPGRLTLAITHLEKDKRLFFLDKIPTDGNFNLKFQFTDAAPHRVSSSAEVEGWGPVRSKSNVTVTSASPPWDVTVWTLILLLCVLVLGLVTGKISRSWKK